MKKLLFALLLLSAKAHADPYVKGDFGSALGVRVGVQDSFDLSYGYLKTDDLRTLSVEAYKVIPYDALLFKAGGGIGYTVPDLEDRKGDNGASFILGAGVEYPLTYNWSIEGSIKGLFFDTKTRKTVYGSHEETLSNGQKVEVLDVRHYYDSERLDTAVLGISLKYSF